MGSAWWWKTYASVESSAIQSFLLFKFQKRPTLWPGILCQGASRHFLQWRISTREDDTCPECTQRVLDVLVANVSWSLDMWQPAALFLPFGRCWSCDQNCCCRCCCCCGRALVIRGRFITSYDWKKKQKTKMKTNVGVLTVRVSVNKCVSVRDCLCVYVWGWLDPVAFIQPAAAADGRRTMTKVIVKTLSAPSFCRVVHGETDRQKK